jgi:hypothetical protein
MSHLHPTPSEHTYAPASWPPPDDSRSWSTTPTGPLPTTTAFPTWRKPDNAPPIPGPRVTPDGARSGDGRDPAAMVTAEFMSWVVTRMVTATNGHATHALQDLGSSADEPGPHALLILSAEPRRTPLVPADWNQPAHGGGVATAEVNCGSRLFHADEADDLLPMLATMTDLIQKRVDAARSDGRLYANLRPDERVAVARAALGGRRWQPEQRPFPYAEAVEQGLLWDPRAPMTGVVGAGDYPLSVASAYVGAAVCSLDTDTDAWTQIKHRYSDGDPQTGMPFITPHVVPAQAWAWLHGGAAIEVQRGAGPDQRGYHHVRANRRLTAVMDSRRDATYEPHLVVQTPPLSAGGIYNGTRTSRELWTALHALHVALADGLHGRPS